MVLSRVYWTAIVTLATLLALGMRPRLTGAILTVLLIPLVPFQERQAGRQAPAVTVLAFAFLRSDAAARRRSRAIVPSNGHLDIAGAPIPLWLAAIGVVIAEYALAAGFWFQRTRRRPRGSGVAFHATLRYVIRIGFLDVVSLFLYAAFLLPLERDVGRRRGPSARIPEA